MENLSIEEKAKRYDEVVEKFDVILNLNTVKESGTIYADDVIKILPELKESEDERIRKEIIDFATKANNGVTSILANNYNFNKWLAWLEKQGEHANFCNKIQVGDKVTRNKDGVLVNISQLNRVSKKDENQGKQKAFDYENVDIQQKDFVPKSATKSIKEEKVDNANKVESFDKYEEFTDFERNLIYICVGWIGGDFGWKQYIKDNADVLLKIAFEKFNSMQWKPNAEQMKALNAINIIGGISYAGQEQELINLYNDLKKL